MKLKKYFDFLQYFTQDNEYYIKDFQPASVIAGKRYFSLIPLHGDIIQSFLFRLPNAEKIKEINDYSSAIYIDKDGNPVSVYIPPLTCFLVLYIINKKIAVIQVQNTSLYSAYTRKPTPACDTYAYVPTESLHMCMNETPDFTPYIPDKDCKPFKNIFVYGAKKITLKAPSFWYFQSRYPSTVLPIYAFFLGCRKEFVSSFLHGFMDTFKQYYQAYLNIKMDDDDSLNKITKNLSAFLYEVLETAATVNGLHQYEGPGVQELFLAEKIDKEIEEKENQARLDASRQAADDFTRQINSRRELLHLFQETGCKEPKKNMADMIRKKFT